MIAARFDQAKTLQAAAYILSLSDGLMNYMKLIKLLYMSDRAAWFMWGRPITGATYYAMKHGPVLSEVLNLIKQPQDRDIWSKYISTIGYDVKMERSPELDDLSNAETDLLRTVTEKFRSYNPWRTVDIIHMCPEWKDPVPLKRLPITFKDILRAQGKTPTEISIVADALSHIGFVQARYGTEP